MPWYSARHQLSIFLRCAVLVCFHGSSLAFLLLWFFSLVALTLSLTRVSAYNLALRTGALINSDSGLLVYAYMPPGGVLHGPLAYVVTTFSRTLTVCPPHMRTRHPNMYRGQGADTE